MAKQATAAAVTEEQEHDEVTEAVSEILEKSGGHLQDAREEMLRRAAGDSAPSGEEEEPEEEELEEEEPEGEAGDDDDDDQLRLIAEAIAFGYSPAEARDFAKKGVLESMLARDARWLGQLQQQTTNAPQQSDDESDEVEPLFNLPLDPDDMDPVVYEAFEKLNTEASKTIKGLKKEVEQLSMYVKQEQEKAYINWFESAVSSLDQYEEHFGKGARSEITPKQARNRGDLLATMSDIAFNAQRSGRPIPSEDQLLRRAIAIVVNDLDPDKSTKSAVRKKVAEEMKRNAKGQFVARPGGSSAAGQTEYERQVAAVAKILNK